MQSIKNLLTKLSTFMPKQFSIQKTLGVFVLAVLVLGLAPRTIEVSRAVNCDTAPTVPTFNPFPVSYADTAPPCFDHPAITARNITRGTGYPSSQGAFDNGIDASAGDELYVLIYIHNGAQQGLNPEAIARNVQVATDFGPNPRTRHQITTTFTGSNVSNSGFSSRVAINTPDNLPLEAVANSGEVFDVNNNRLASGLNLANTTYLLNGNGDQLPCFEFAQFLRFRVRVVGAANGSLQVTKDVANVTQNGQNFNNSASANLNDNLTYRIRIQNTSSVVLNNVVLTDNIGQLVDLSPARNITAGGRTFSGTNLGTGLNFGTMQPNETITLTYDTTVNNQQNFVTTLTNTANATASNASPSQDQAVVTVQPAAQNGALALQKFVKNTTQNGSYATSATAVQNDTVTYQLTIVNNSSVVLNNVRTTDNVFSQSGLTNVRNVNVSRGFSGSLNGTGIQFNTLQPNESATITYDATVNTQGPATINNTATSVADNAPQRTATATVSVQNSQGTLSLTKQVRNNNQGGQFQSSVTAVQNDTVNYQLRVRNTSNSVTLNNVIITDNVFTQFGLTNVRNVQVNRGFAGNLNGTGIQFNTLQPNEEAIITYDATVSATSSTTITNTATARANNAPQVNATATVSTQVLNGNLSITKQVRNNTQGGNFSSFAQARQGDTVEYQVRLTNNGQGTLQNVTLRDQLNNSGITINQNSITPFYSGTLIGGLTIGTIQSGATVTVNYTGTVTATTSTTITNTATAQATGVNPQTATASVSVQQILPAQLTITKQVRNVTQNGAFAGSANANQNDIVEYRVVVNNVGQSAATNVTLRDQLNNSGITIDQNSISPSFGGSLTGGLNLNTIQPNQPVTVTYRGTVTVNGPATITNTATASATGINSISANATVNVAQVNQNTTLSIVKQVSNVTRGTGFADTVNAQNGDIVDYRVQIQNTGSVNATGLILTDVIPSGVSLQGGLPTVTGGFSVSGSLQSGLSISGNLAPGQNVIVTYRATVNQNNGNILNTATARANNASPVSDTATIVVQVGTTTLSIIKDVQNLTQNTGYNDSVTARNGDVVQYRITVRNTGNGSAQNVRISDNVFNLNQLTVNNSSVSVSRGFSGSLSNAIILNNDLESNGVVTITYTATVNSSNGTVTNTATVSANNINPLSDTAQVTLSDNRTNLSIQKTVRNITNNTNNGFVKNVDARTNDQVEFRLEVTNTGSVTANQVTLSDVVPSGLSFISGSVSSSNGNGSDSLNTTGGLNLSNLTQNQIVTVFFRATVNQNFNGSVTNIARASASNADPVTSNAVVNVTQISNGSLTITKLVRSLDFNTGFSRFLNVQNGERVEYQIRVTAQNGRVDNVQLYENFPFGQVTLLGGSGRLNGAFIDDGFLSRTISLGSLENGQTATLTFQATAQSFGNNSSITNTATATGTNVGQVSDTATLTIAQNGQLMITKLVRNNNSNSYQNSVNANNGDRVSFQITVRNSGSGTINNVRVTDSIPSGLTIDNGSVRLDNNVVNGNSFLDVFIGSLFGGQQRVITFDATVNSGVANTSIQNIARATGDNAPQVSDDAFVVLGNTTPATNLVFSKRAFNDTQNVEATSVNAQREDFITYTLSVTNNGSSNATSFVITDDLSGVLPFADMVDNGGGYVSGNIITFPGVDIAAGATVSKTFKVRVKFSLDNNQSFQMTNTYGNTVRITIPGNGGFIAPKTGSSSASAITFSGLLTTTFFIFRRRKELMSMILA